MAEDSDIQPLDRGRDAVECTELMLSSEPWITLRLARDTALAVLGDPAKEVYAIRDEAGIAGFVVIDMRSLVRGYVQILCVRADCRGVSTSAAASDRSACSATSSSRATTRSSCARREERSRTSASRRHCSSRLQPACGLRRGG